MGRYVQPSPVLSVLGLKPLLIAPSAQSVAQVSKGSCTAVYALLMLKRPHDDEYSKDKRNCQQSKTYAVRDDNKDSRVCKWQRTCM